jgi:hypothetical protein
LVLLSFRSRLAVACVILLTSSSVAAAQEKPLGGYLFGGLDLCQASGITGTDNLYMGMLPAPGGSTFDWRLGGGFGLTSRVAAEVEVSRTGTLSATASDHYGNRSRVERHGVVIAGLLKYSILRARPTGVEVAAGVFVRDAPGTVTSLPSTLVSGTTAPGGQEYAATWHSGMGLVLGADLRVGHGHLAFVPGVRVLLPLGGVDDAKGDVSSELRVGAAIRFSQRPQRGGASWQRTLAPGRPSDSTHSGRSPAPP